MPDRFRTALREMRITAGLSQTRLAAKMGYTKSYLSRIETGERPATEDVARAADFALMADGALIALFHQAGAHSYDGHDDDASAASAVSLLERGLAALARRLDALASEVRRYHPEILPAIPSPRDADDSAAEQTPPSQAASSGTEPLPS